MKIENIKRKKRISNTFIKNLNIVFENQNEKRILPQNFEEGMKDYKKLNEKLIKKNKKLC